MIRTKKTNSYHSALRSGSKVLVGVSAIAPAFPQGFIVLFYIFALYLSVPVVDVPLLSLSLSAPIFFIIAIKCLLKPPKPWFTEYRFWIFTAVIIWSAIIIAALLNGVLSSGVDFNDQGFISLIYFAYFLLVFVITVYFSSQGNILEKTSEILSWGVVVLALLRLGEALIFGRVGEQSNPVLLTQNSYGMLFSSFSPFVLLRYFDAKGIKKNWQLFLIFLVWGTVAVNGSRSSWVAMAVGLIIVLTTFLLRRPRQFVKLLAILVVVGAIGSLVLLARPEIFQGVEERFTTFRTLESDKSYETRKLLNQKSMKLFASSPIIGVGTGRYRIETVQLDLPDILSHRSESYFNRISAHNSYLTFLAENGLLGAIPLAALILTLLIRGLKYSFRFSHQGQFWALAIFVGFIQMSIHMWSLSTFSNTMNWFVYGLVGAMIVRGKNAAVNVQQDLAGT